METRPDLFAAHDTPEGVTCATCPLRVAMERIAQVALRQHVLYLEGECQPRVELLRELEASYTLERLIRTRICAVSRGSVASDCPLSA